MDKINEKNERKEKRRRTNIGIRELIRAELDKRRAEPRTIILDITVFLVGLIFARSPLFFGAHPIAPAFIAVLPQRVWGALAGIAIGSLTLGSPGIIYAMISVIIAFLRVIISGGDKRSDASTPILFGENLLLRMSAAIIGGFISAVYEILLSGFTVTSVLFGLTMILMPPILVFGFFGLFDSGISFAQLFGAGRNVFAKPCHGREKISLIFFQVSALLFVFMVSISLREYSLFGISVAYLFATAVTLVAARRFGAIRAAAVGFVSTLGLSSLYSVAFMLAGLSAGALFSIGAIYAVAAGAVAVGALSAYAGGVTGLVSTLPEYAIGAALIYPVINRLPIERTQAETEKTEKSAIDMVGTMALAYKNSSKKTVNATISALSSLAGAVDTFLLARPTETEIGRIVYSIIKERAPNCEFDDNIKKIATKLYKNDALNVSDVDYLNLGGGEEELLAQIKLTHDSLVTPNRFAGDELRLLAGLINESRLYEEVELSMNDTLTDSLEEVLEGYGFPDGVIRAFGTRRKHIILAGHDEDGTLITSKDLFSALERAAGVRLGSPEYFRRDSMALMECTAVGKYTVEYGCAARAAQGTDISGDIAHKFETADGMFYALIADGMGSGEIARRAASFTASMLEKTLALGSSRDTVLHLLNGYLLRGREECSVALDLFEFDTVNKEAVFIKSGAAPSYIKRGNSIFRIRSQTAPLGIMSSIDTERIRVQVMTGDYIIMFSDGITESPEDSPWLLELLSAKTPSSPAEYAGAILAVARTRAHTKDDMTVTVMRIDTAP